MDERMHTTPRYWTTHEPTTTTHRDHSHMHDVGLPNCRPRNLVQMGIGGWYGSRPGSKVALRRGTSVMTMHDIEEFGAAKAAEMALEMAWKGCKAVYLSFDIDALDPSQAPADEVARCVPRTLGRLTAADATTSRLTGTTSNPAWYAEQLAAIPASYRILSCPELQDAARVLGRRLLAATG